MFENLEKPFKFCSVSLLKTEDVNQQFTANMVRYVKYCENELTQILNEVNMLPEQDNKAKILEDFENVYQEKIISLMDDITSEMFNLQNFVEPLLGAHEAFIKPILEEIDGVEALLMLLPEEIEKVKCLLMTFLK